jgi:predicted dehydrogenase
LVVFPTADIQGMNLRLGVLGTSAIGVAHVRNFCALPGVSVVSVYSRDRQRAANFARICGIKHYTTELDEILENGAINAALITTEPSRHIDLARKCCAADKHVLIEKPVDVDLAKARQFAKELAQTRTTVSVVSQMRFDPALTLLHGRLRTVLGTSPLIAAMSVMCRRDQSYYAHGSGWRARSPFFENQGIHWIDVLGWFFGSPSGVQRSSRITRPFLTSPDQSGALVEFDSGAAVSLIGGSFCNQDHVDSFRIFGAAGSWDYRKERSRSLSKVGKLAPFLERLEGRFFRKDDLYRQAVDFSDAIRHNRPPTTTLDQAISALALAQEVSGLER